MRIEISIDPDEVRAIIAKAQTSLNDVATKTAAASGEGSSLVSQVSACSRVAAELQTLLTRGSSAMDTALDRAEASVSAMRSALEDFVTYEDEVCRTLEAHPDTDSQHVWRAV